MSQPTPDPSLHLQGQLLLADPSLRDSLFSRSVVLLAEHTAEHGASGVILNHPTGHTVGDLLKDETFHPIRHLDVHIGGPVSREHLTFSAFWWHPEEGLKWHVRIPAEQAIRRSRQPGTLVRAFIGYSGWSPGQLESELGRQSWIPSFPDANLLGQSHDRSLWQVILRNLSPYHRLIAESPENPDLN